MTTHSLRAHGGQADSGQRPDFSTNKSRSCSKSVIPHLCPLEARHDPSFNTTSDNTHAALYHPAYALSRDSLDAGILLEWYQTYLNLVRRHGLCVDQCTRNSTTYSLHTCNMYPICPMHLWSPTASSSIFAHLGDVSTPHLKLKAVEHEKSSLLPYTSSLPNQASSTLKHTTVH